MGSQGKTPHCRTVRPRVPEDRSVEGSLDMLRAAVIGCGFQGKLHVEILGDLGVEIVGICDTNAERLEQVGNEFGVSHRYTNYEDLLEAQRLDLVSVCTMPNSHVELCTAALG